MFCGYLFKGAVILSAAGMLAAVHAVGTELKVENSTEYAIKVVPHSSQDVAQAPLTVFAGERGSYIYSVFTPHITIYIDKGAIGASAAYVPFSQAHTFNLRTWWGTKDAVGSAPKWIDLVFKNPSSLNPGLLDLRPPATPVLAQSAHGDVVVQSNDLFGTFVIDDSQNYSSMGTLSMGA